MKYQKVTDQLGRQIKIPIAPRRIISLVPSQTELLFDLQLDENIVAITKFCVHPAEKCKTKDIVGGTKKLKVEKIKSLKPDLIIANKEENTQEDIEYLSKFYPVWISDITNLSDALEMIRSIGNITQTAHIAENIIKNIENKFETIKNFLPPIKICYLIWYKPLMGAGKNTFIDSLLQYCGLENILKEERYPEVNLSDMPDDNIFLLSSEPFPFKEKHKIEIEKAAAGSKCLFVDGEMFSWYGSRLLQFPDYIKSISTDLISSQKLP